MPEATSIISIRDLTVYFESNGEKNYILNGLSLDVRRGQTLALVGESGSGKTLAALAILGLLPAAATLGAGSITFNGENLLDLKEDRLQEIRGDRIGMIFQESGMSLNPLMPIGKQIGETLIVHRGLARRNAHEQVIALMEMVGIPDPRRRYNNYPHQLSGGARQRVVIAMALACRPDLLLADEPTTSLDSTVQAQILDLMSRLIQDLRMSVLLISHDIGVVASLADRVAVMHAGLVVEEGNVHDMLKSPLHPYTRALLDARPSLRKAVLGDQLAAFTSSIPADPSAMMGCPLADVCKQAMDICRLKPPPMVLVDQDHSVRCLLFERSHD